ncbi:MAG: hypothetical protein GEU93_09715 [Propionibacteriales bacterium]|nr:hypothetical protein [Propionibacteriales bacterium]
MRGRMAGWRAAVRIARRDALRARGRSALVAAMVGVPVMLTTALAVLVNTAEVGRHDATPPRRARAPHGRPTRSPTSPRPGWSRSGTSTPARAAAWVRSAWSEPPRST